MPMTYIIEGSGALVNETGEETPLKAGDFALVYPSEKHQYRNKGDKPFKMVCGVPKEFEEKDCSVTGTIFLFFVI